MVCADDDQVMTSYWKDMICKGLQLETKTSVKMTTLYTFRHSMLLEVIASILNATVYGDLCVSSLYPGLKSPFNRVTPDFLLTEPETIFNILTSA